MRTLDFVLYGGTAIALRLGHRFSVDFDFFSNAPLDRAALRLALPFLESARVTQDVSHTYSAVVAVDDEPVTLSFFGNLHLGRVGTPELTSDEILQVASLDDLFAFKLGVVSQRVQARDYIDIAEILRHNLSLEHGLASAQAIYGTQFQPAETLKALTYFEGGDLSILQEADKEMLRTEAGRVQTIPIIERSSDFFCSDCDRDGRGH